MDIKDKLESSMAVLDTVNAVSGFYPESLVVNIPTKDGMSTTPYLQVGKRVSWFKLRYPTGLIETVVTFPFATEKFAMFTAKVYADAADKEHSLLAETQAADYFTDKDQFCQIATAAVGRALSFAGFGVQVAEEAEETPCDCGATPVAAQQQEAPVEPPTLEEALSSVAPPFSGFVGLTFRELMKKVRGKKQMQMLEEMAPHSDAAACILNGIREMAAKKAAPKAEPEDDIPEENPVPMDAPEELPPPDDDALRSAPMWENPGI